MGTKQELSKYLVILLQIVMMSCGTHLVKNMSPSPEPLDLLVTTQLIQRQTPKLCITVY